MLLYFPRSFKHSVLPFLPLKLLKSNSFYIKYSFHGNKELLLVGVGRDDCVVTFDVNVKFPCSSSSSSSEIAVIVVCSVVGWVDDDTVVGVIVN